MLIKPQVSYLMIHLSFNLHLFPNKRKNKKESYCTLVGVGDVSNSVIEERHVQLDFSLYPALKTLALGLAF